MLSSFSLILFIFHNQIGKQEVSVERMWKQSQAAGNIREYSAQDLPQSSLCYAYGTNAYEFFNNSSRDSNSISFELECPQNNIEAYEKKSQYSAESQLSKIIMSGLSQARQSVEKSKLLCVMEETYRKQLELQIQLNNQMERLIMCELLREGELEAHGKMEQLQENIRNLMQQIGLKCRQIYKCDAQHTNLGIKSQPNYDEGQDNRNGNYNIVKIVNGKIKIEREKSTLLSNPNTNSSRQSILKVFSSTNEETISRPNNLSPIYNKQRERSSKTKQSDNASVYNRSGPSAISNQNLTSNITYARTEASTPVSMQKAVRERKKVLLARKCLMEEQIEQTHGSYERKVDMLQREIELLKRELVLANEQINNGRMIEKRKTSTTPTHAKKPQQYTNYLQPRSPRLLSYSNTLKKSPSRSRIFGYKSKANRPSMFVKAKQSSNNLNANSSRLHSCKSQNKFTSKLSALPNYNLISEMATSRKANHGHFRNQYFDRRVSQRVINSKCTYGNYSRLTGNQYY